MLDGACAVVAVVGFVVVVTGGVVVDVDPATAPSWVVGVVVPAEARVPRVADGISTAPRTMATMTSTHPRAAPDRSRGPKKSWPPPAPRSAPASLIACGGAPPCLRNGCATARCGAV